MKSQRTYQPAILVALALAVLALPAAATTYNVTTTADGNDGACDDHCTLREAIIAANADRDRDVINVPGGTYRLSIAGRGEDRAAAGDLDILERIDLRGAAQERTVIDADGLDRALHVHVMEWYEGAEPVEISDLTVTGGSVSNHDRGGGVFNVGALKMKRCTVAGNATDGYDADGGGIANSGVLALDNVTVSNNSTSGDNAEGGGIWNRYGVLALADSEISANRTSGSDGAGLFTEYGTVAMTRVTVSSNTNGAGHGDGGGVWAGFSTVALAGCTISDNTINAIHGGGGIWADISTITVVNSTVSGNTVHDGLGGGIWTDDCVLALTSCTISGNTVDGGHLNSDAIWSGGGTVVLTNTLVDGSCSMEKDIQSGGGNLESPGNSCGFDRATDQSGVSSSALALGPLADNGGATLTHALLAGSVAIDSALNYACLSFDQRGERRPQDGDGDGAAVCDVGAYEAGSEPHSPSYAYWVPVAVHDAGANASQWRTTLGALNRSSSPAELEVVLRTSDEVFSMIASVPAYGQGVFADIAGQLGVQADKGTLEVRSDRPLYVTSRTFNQSAEGTFGQYMAGMTADQGLRAGQSATLPQLTQSAAYRSNLGLANMGAVAATVEVTLYDASGYEVGALEVELAAGQLHQINTVFSSVAGLDDVDGGYAEVEVRTGSGVVAYASVVDDGTGDATTIPMWR